MTQKEKKKKKNKRKEENDTSCRHKEDVAHARLEPSTAWQHGRRRAQALKRVAWWAIVKQELNVTKLLPVILRWRKHIRREMERKIGHR